MLNTIYFDNNATTRVDDEVMEAMIPYFKEQYGNAASKLHAFGWQAEAAVDKAKEQIASLINCEPGELIFTSGATESINLAIKGIYEAYKTKGKHIITVKTEHKAVLDVCMHLEKLGASVTYLNVDKEGVIDIEELEKAITNKTILIAVMAANNETGVLQDIEKIGQICAERKIIFFTDATQYIGKMRCDVVEQHIHCMAFSAHKFHGPKGVGALYVRRKEPRVNVLAQMHGGSHQNNLRSGTLNVTGIVGMAKALEVAQRDQWEVNAHISKFKNHFEHQLLDLEGLTINGSTRNRLYNTSNIKFPKQLNLKDLLNQFAFSSGSACTSFEANPSHVLKAMNLSDEEVKYSYRFSFSKYNNLNEVKAFLEKLLK
ncbi:MAG: cysteine desulfurase family protein [Bacteroidota bacterium]|nr:cysteine desulfurase family protein [Bacteroidota bacterium]